MIERYVYPLLISTNQFIPTNYTESTQRCCITSVFNFLIAVIAVMLGGTIYFAVISFPSNREALDDALECYDQSTRAGCLTCLAIKVWHVAR